jgi:2',3'-cyclic-nucleotide 2'-phosphodiesterase (5'-nucleotidase family)
VPVVRATGGGRDVAQVDLWVGPGGDLAGLDVRFLPVDASLSPDPALAPVRDETEAALARVAARPAGTTAVALDGRLEAAGVRESALGNLVADLAREGTGAAAALVDAGSIGPVAIGTGPLPGDLPLRLFPDLGPLAVLEVSGADLAAALEHALGRLPTPSTRFVQLSGLRVTFDAGARVGARVRGVATAGGGALDPARRYRVAVSARLAAGADGQAGLRAARRLVAEDSAPLLAYLLLARMRAGAPLAPAVEGRLRAARPRPE